MLQACSCASFGRPRNAFLFRLRSLHSPLPVVDHGGAFASARGGADGLLKRISLCVLHLFGKFLHFRAGLRPHHNLGAVILRLIPSINARPLSTPIALTSATSWMGARRLRACGLFGACYVGFVLRAHVRDGSFYPPLRAGGYSPGIPRRHVAGLAPLVAAVGSRDARAGMGLYIIWAYKPSKSVRLTKDNVAEQIRISAR